MQIPNNYVKHSRLICIARKSQEKGELKYIYISHIMLSFWPLKATNFKKVSCKAFFSLTSSL